MTQLYMARYKKIGDISEIKCNKMQLMLFGSGGLAQLVATLVGSTKLLYAGQG